MIKVGRYFYRKCKISLVGLHPFKVILSLLMGAAPVATTVACDCARSSFDEEVQYCDLIFVGRIIEFNELEQVTVKVETVFKGALSEEITIKTSVSDCDYFLPPIRPATHEVFLLFAHQEDNIISVSRYSPSGNILERTDELKKLKTWKESK